MKSRYISPDTESGDRDIIMIIIMITTGDDDQLIMILAEASIAARARAQTRQMGSQKT